MTVKGFTGHRVVVPTARLHKLNELLPDLESYPHLKADIQLLAEMFSCLFQLGAVDLIQYMQKEFGESLPPTTVYRILDFLAGENMVHKLHLANKYIAYSHISSGGAPVPDL